MPSCEGRCWRRSDVLLTAFDSSVRFVCSIKRGECYTTTRNQLFKMDTSSWRGLTNFLLFPRRPGSPVVRPPVSVILKSHGP